MISNELKQHIKVGKVCNEVIREVKFGLSELSTDEIYTYLQRLREEKFDREFTYGKRKFKYLKKEFIREIRKTHSEIYDEQLSKLLTELFNRGVDYDELRQEIYGVGFGSFHIEQKLREEIEEQKINKVFEEIEKSEEYQTNTDVRKRIQTMKSALKDTVQNDFNYPEKVRKHSSKLLVIAEVRKHSEDKEVYGYIVKNITTETIELEDFEISPDEEKLLQLKKFVQVSAQPEISFKYINGKVCHNKSIDEVIKIERENNGLIAYNTFQFKQAEDWQISKDQQMKVIYMEDSE